MTFSLSEFPWSGTDAGLVVALQLQGAPDVQGMDPRAMAAQLSADELGELLEVWLPGVPVSEVTGDLVGMAAGRVAEGFDGWSLNAVSDYEASIMRLVGRAYVGDCAELGRWVAVAQAVADVLAARVGEFRVAVDAELQGRVTGRDVLAAVDALEARVSVEGWVRCERMLRAAVAGSPGDVRVWEAGARWAALRDAPWTARFSDEVDDDFCAYA